MAKKLHLFFNDVFAGGKNNIVVTRCGRFLSKEWTKTDIEEVTCEQCKILGAK